MLEIYIFSLYFVFSCVENQEIPLSPKRQVSDENLETDDLKKSRVEEVSEEFQILEALDAGCEAAEVGPEEATAAERQDGEPVTEEYLIGKRVV